MEESHLPLDVMAKWLAGKLEHEEVVRRIIPHIVSRCPVCRERYEEMKKILKEQGHWDETVALFEGQEAPELFQRIAELPYDEQLRIVAEDESFHSWGFCQLLLNKSRETVSEDPAKAVELAHLAVQVSSHLGEAYDPHWVLDLRARTFAHLGNARRVLTELRSAEDAFRDAERCLSLSTTGNALIAGEILDLKSSLRRAQRRLDEALALVNKAEACYREAGEPHGTGKVFLKKIQILSELGDTGQAIGLLQQPPPEIDPASEPRLFTYARYNLLGCLTFAGRYSEAEALLPEVRDLLTTHGQPLDLVRLRWAEGNIALGLGRIPEAEAGFREVQQAFLDRRMGYDAALVSLDMAALYAQEHRTDDLKRLALEIVPVFESRDVHREAMAALLMFQHACEEETLTAGLARHLASILRQERRR